MNPFTDHHVSALRALRNLWKDRRFSLIGAAGLACQMADFYRQTADLDIVVAASLNSLPSALDQLPGWQKHSLLEHRWVSPMGVRVDIIPAGPDHLAAGAITWPSGHSMTLLGLSHAFSRVRRVTLAPDLRVDVAAVPVIALLKVVAYQESPTGRDRDLGDLAHILEYYVSEDDGRRYSDEVFEAELRHQEVSSFLLGRDLAEFVGERERDELRSFIARVEGETDGGVTQSIMVRQAPTGWRQDPDLVLIAVRALGRGLGEK